MFGIATFEPVETDEGVPDPRLLAAADAAHRAVGRAQLSLLRTIAELDRQVEDWEVEGARDVEHFLGMRYGLSRWRAERWLGAARALERLPHIARALETGQLGIDKVVELARFATPETERDLLAWARHVSCGAIRHRGDLEARASREEAERVVDGRYLEWRYVDEGRRFRLETEMPAVDGPVVVAALERHATRIPVMPDEADPYFAAARYADAFVALCSGSERPGAGPEPPTVVVHARLSSLLDGSGGAELQDGPAIPLDAARRLACDARIQVVLEDASGDVVGLGRTAREPSVWMLRQLRYRDRECRFPGCGARRFTQAHHIVWWSRGGRTDLDNLVLLCGFHHRLVHELGWRLTRAPDGRVSWFRPDGTGYLAGPSPGVPLAAAG